MMNPKGKVASAPNELSKYLEYLRVSYQTFLAYRVRYYVGVLTYIVHVGVYFFLYQALFNNEGTIQGYSLQQMVTYIAVGWLAKSFYLNYVDHELATEVRLGHLAMNLIKPVDFQLMWYFRGCGQSLFRLTLFTPPIIVVTLIFFPITAPPDTQYLLLFIGSTFLSAMIYLGINFIFGVLSVFFLSIEGILYPKNLMIELFSGLLIPIDWFPRWFQILSDMLPFKSIAYVPLSIYLGRFTTSESARAMLIQCLWAIGLFGFGRILWTLSQRKVLIQGG